MRNRKCLAALILAFALAMPGEIFAGTASVTTYVRVLVPEVNEIAFLTGSVNLKKNIDDTEKLAEFSCLLSLNGPRSRKVTARLEGPLPKGIRMFIEMQSPGTGESTGKQILGAEPVILLSGLSDLGTKTVKGLVGLLTDLETEGQEGFNNIILSLEYE